MTPKEIQILQVKCNIIEEKIKLEYIDQTGNCKAVPDGIVNVPTYGGSDYRILWILKEPYDEIIDGIASGGGDPMSDFVFPDGFAGRMGKSAQTWHPIIYVTYGILNDFILWDEMKTIKNDPSMADVAKHIAVINVNKIPALTKSDMSTIEVAYHKHKELLHNQIRIYEPQIIIGGSVLPLFYDELGLKKNDEKNFGSVEYYEKDNQLFIAAYHPSQYSTVIRENYVNDIIELAMIWTKKHSII